MTRYPALIEFLARETYPVVRPLMTFMDRFIMKQLGKRYLEEHGKPLSMEFRKDAGCPLIGEVSEAEFARRRGGFG